MSDNLEVFQKFWEREVLGIAPEPQEQPIESGYPVVRDGGSVTASQLPPQPTPEQQFEQFMIKNGINTVNSWD